MTLIESGSGANLMMRWAFQVSSRMTFAAQVEVGAAEHLSFDHL
jgi:hypothetical protein